MKRNARHTVLALAAIAAASLGSASALAQGEPAPTAPATAAPATAAPAPAPAGEKWSTNPATAADPPLLPRPGHGTQAPMSTSGTDVTPPTNQPPPAPVVVQGKVGEASLAKLREVEARLALAEARGKTLENDLGPLRNLKVQGYIQLQYLVESYNAAASPNLVNGSLPQGITSNDVIAKPDGTTTNDNRFRLRRTRLRTIYETDVVRAYLQVELLPAGGPTATEKTIARNAEVTGIAHWTEDIKTEITAGLFQVPFRAEIIEQSMHRPWIERTQASQQLFPSGRDLGLHAKTFVKEDLLTFDIGVINGQRIGEKAFVVQPDLNAAKDFFATATSKLGPVTMNVAGYVGRGQTVDATLLRVKSWKRLGANLGAVAAHRLFPKLGESKLMAELMFGTNMDTGARYAFALPRIPVAFSADVTDLNERGFYVRAEQELTKWGLAGFRYDTYTTDSSLKNNGVDTYALMAGLRLSKYLRIITEGSFAIDNIHPDGAGAPSRQIYGYTAWMQGSFY